jgi:SAM-dependent methyltransferase
MTVTVLLPVYNGAATLSTAISSILAQDDEDFELLVIDDCSRDNSREIAAGFAGRDPRVTLVVHDQNVGLSATLNEGLRRASTRLVARMDQDDEALRARLRVQRQFMEARPGVVAAGSYVWHRAATRRYDRLITPPHTPRGVASRLQRENCLYHPSVIMRRAEVLEAGGYRAEFKNAEDYDLWLRLAREHDLANVPEPLLRYRFSADGMTLGRKWEQLYYVHLAQAGNEHPELPPRQVEALAQARLAAVDRRRFMRQVGTGTVDELIRLRLWSEALRVARAFSREVAATEAAMIYARYGVTGADVLAEGIADIGRTRLRASPWRPSEVELTGGGERVDIDLRTTPPALEQFDLYQLSHWRRYEFARTQIKPGDAVGDFACGTGYGTVLMAGIASRVVGVDVDSRVIRQVSKRYAQSPNTRFLRSDLRKLTFSNQFDLIVSFETIEHFSPADIPRVLQVFARSLRPGGRLITSTPYRQERTAAAEALGFHNTYDIDENRLTDWLIDAGFEVEGFWYQDYATHDVQTRLEAPDFVLTLAKLKES